MAKSGDRSSDGASSSNSNSLASAEEISPEVVVKLKEAIYGAAGIMSAVVQDEDVIICLGSTRGGKSTIVNQLIGNPLKVEKNTQERKIYLVKAEADLSNQKGPAIGNTSTSETVFPSRWLSKKSGYMNEKVVWDAPGFDDSRGPIQDITNAFYVKSLLRGVKSAKLVLVSDYNQLSGDDISNFIKLLDSVKRVFKETTKDISNSISLIFTKVPVGDEFDIIDTQFLCELLNSKVVNSPSDIDQDCRNIVKSLTSNPERIGIFRKAMAGSDISKLEERIDSAISFCRPLEKSFLSHVSPSVSEGANIFLRRVSDQLSDKAEKEIETLLQYVKKGYDKEIERVKKDAEGKKSTEVSKLRDEVVEKVGAIKTLLPQKTTPAQESNSTSASSDPQIKKESLTEKLIAIKNHNKEVGDLIETLKIMEIVKFLEFLDGLLNINTCGGIYKSVIENNIRAIIAEFDKLILNLAEKLGEISKPEAEARIVEITKEQEKLKKENLELAAQIKENNSKTNKKGLEKAFGDFGQASGELIGNVADSVIEGVTKLVPAYIEKKCTIQLLSDIEYDNPLLNDSNFLQLFTKTYGMSATSRLIDLTSVLIEDHREELKEIVSDPGAIEILGNLIGEQYDFS